MLITHPCTHQPFPFQYFGLRRRGLGRSRIKKAKEMVVGCTRAAIAERVPRRMYSPMRTLRVRITTRSARHDHCPFSKWVRAKVSISAQNKTSDEVNERGEAAREKEKGEIRRRVATKWLGEGTEKWAVLFLVSYPKIIFSKL